ncbi:hypothetical protein [Pseudorhodoferax sp.]|nr:hypothetical protein [Pseudorhodoferax sp.]
MNFSLWMALAFAQSNKMSQLMMWPMWPYASALPRKPEPSVASRV